MDEEFAEALHKAGGCYCRECKHCINPEENKALFWGLLADDIPIGLTFITPDDFCSYGERKETQDDETD